MKPIDIRTNDDAAYCKALEAEAVQWLKQHPEPKRKNISVKASLGAAYDMAIATMAAPPQWDETSELRMLAIEGAVEMLDEPMRSIIDMYFWDGMSYEQIAKALGLGKTTVRRYAAKAREELGELLGSIENILWPTGGAE